MSTKTVKKRVAILAIGRFSPPHAGHIQLLTYCWRLAHAKKEQGEDACAYCWVSPSDKEMNRPKITGEDSKNPLSTADKLHYLCKMIPAEDISEKLASGGSGIINDFELKFLVSRRANTKDEFESLGSKKNISAVGAAINLNNLSMIIK